ncbi:MAG: hypothetical protein ACI9KK_000293 [Ascidiaceihabitans sp.]|jgi:hypothetical protein
MRKVLLSLLITALPLAASAVGLFSHPKILKVKAISPTNFEVIEGPDSGPRAYWCAAALHVENTLGRQQSRIYIAEGRGPSVTAPGRKAVQFTTVPFGDVGPSVSVSIRQAGYNLGSGHALRFCDDYISSDIF